MILVHHERAHEFNGRIDEIRNMAIARGAAKEVMDNWKQEMHSTFAGTEQERRQYLDADDVYYRLEDMLGRMKEEVLQGPVSRSFSSFSR